MGMILRIALSRIVGQGHIVGRSRYFSLNLSANSVMRGRLDARRTLKSLVADLRFTYEEFRSKTRLGTDSFFSKFNLELPILASYNVALNNKWNLRINAGPYLSYAMFGRDKSIDYAYGNGMHSSLGWWHQDFPDHFTYGGRTGVSLESEHFIYTIDGKCSLRKRPFGRNVSLSAGVGYKF